MNERKKSRQWLGKKITGNQGNREAKTIQIDKEKKSLGIKKQKYKNLTKNKNK